MKCWINKKKTTAAKLQSATTVVTAEIAVKVVEIAVKVVVTVAKVVAARTTAHKAPLPHLPPNNSNRLTSPHFKHNFYKEK